MPLKESEYVKIRATVPLADAERVRQAMAKAGAGKQGHYSHCSSSYSSLGRFTPAVGARPTVGSLGQAEEVPEETIEMLCHRDLVSAVIAALRAVHPYEEPAIDILPRLELE